MSKEHYIAAHEALVEEEMDRTGCDWTTAYERTADRAHDRMRDNLADAADVASFRTKARRERSFSDDALGRDN